jgi:integrase
MAAEYVPKPRRQGDGSLYRTKDGIWVGAVTRTAMTGEKIRRTVKSRDPKVAERKLDAVVRQLAERGHTFGETTTVRQWLQVWTDEVLPGTVTPKTLSAYTRACAASIVPYIGDVRLARLGPEHIQRLIRAHEARGLQPRSIRYIRAILRRALAHAVLWRKVDRNVAALVASPKVTARIRDDLNAEQAEAVLAVAGGTRWEAFFHVLLMLGLRPGEALALRWDDVDLDNGTLHVVRSKTPSGVRALPLPHPVVAVLRAHKARQAADQLAARYWHDPGLVFADEIGDTVDRRVAGGVWHTLCEQAGVPRRRMYCTRHTAATLMVNAGVPLEVVTAILGHSSIRVTMDFYARVDAERLRAAADAMDRIFARPG